MEKKLSRIRRSKTARSKMRELRATRLCVHRTPRHIYAQIIAPEGDKVIASASTVEKDLRGSLDYTGNVDAAAAVGKLVAERAKAQGVEAVAAAGRVDRLVAREVARVPEQLPDDGCAARGVERGQDAPMGGIGLRLNNGTFEFGYWLGKPYWGQGYATEAARTLLHRSIEDIEQRIPQSIRKAQTSREIAGLPVLPDVVRRAFQPITRAVERSWFGGRPLDADPNCASALRERFTFMWRRPQCRLRRARVWPRPATLRRGGAPTGVRHGGRGPEVADCAPPLQQEWRCFWPVRPAF